MGNVMKRETLILETFELSREIGYRHFLAENLHRPDPVLSQLNIEEREAFLRTYWDGHRDRMFAGYQEKVSEYSVNALLDTRDYYSLLLESAGLFQGNKDKGEWERIQRASKDMPDGEKQPQERSKDNGREM
jgi:hypothetical protein